MELDDLSLRLGLALAIGFVVGLERGWHERGMEEGARAAGVRTFSLIGLLGGVLGALSLGGDRLVLAAGLVTVATAAGAFMWREGERHKDFSVTSLVAAILTLVLGVGTVMLVACIVTLALQLFGILDGNFDVREVELQGLAEADYTTGLIALGAGVAAMLSFETRGQSAVGVAISVTTVPAAAFFGAAIALGEITQAWGALLVLGINLVLLVIGGSITLFCQRQFTPVHRK